MKRIPKKRPIDRGDSGKVLEGLMAAAASLLCMS